MGTTSADAGTSAWDERAACAGRLDLPWLTDTVLTSRVDRAAMRSTCSGCVVRAACAEFVRAGEVTGGWWAGKDRDPAAVALLLARPAMLVLPGLEHLGGVA